MTPNRRDIIAALAALAALPTKGIAAALPRTGGQRFSWAWLQQEAAALAKKPYTPPPPPAPGIDRVDYDALNSIRYKPSETRLRGAAGGVRFFPTNHFQPTPVEIHLVDGDIATPFAYSPALFEMPTTSPLAALGDKGGLSGFRAMNASGESDWLAFAGASYFRSAGALDQYGLSARGLAIDTGGPETEEFPNFTKFWLGKAADGALLVDALLEGPSVVGAFRFVNRKQPGGIVQDVEVSLHLRKDVARLGLAPLTSMFWYDQSARAQASDWRPEIHDSDGLLMWNGKGERIWRALGNPPHAITNSFADRTPRGFGLIQRDRVFDHYQDDGVFYEKRPTAWLEPKGDWGAGAVTLVELPTDSETNDNIVAFWTPAAPARAGKSYRYAYRLRWIAGEPLPGDLARVIDTWRGAGGRPGHPQIRGTTKLVADFEGAALAGLTRDSGVTVDLVVGHGRGDGITAYPVVGRGSVWRVMADVTPAGTDPVDLRIALRRGDTPLSEVLLLQMFPG